MYSKDEVSKIKQEFWRGFGQYLTLHTSIDGQKVNWINYKTGIRYINFRMDADRNQASIWIEINNPSIQDQARMYERLSQLKPMLESHVGEPWHWHSLETDATGHTKSSVGITKSGLNILNRAHWSDITAFLKPRMLALDAFWAQAQYAFEEFR